MLISTVIYNDIVDYSQGILCAIYDLVIDG